MRKGQLILRLTALAVIVAFGFGVVRLMLMRFESGDVYSPYSSLRTDPLGVRAFYESLEQLDGVSVRRNYKPLKKLTRDDGDTLFYLGVDTGAMPDELDTVTSQPFEKRKTAAKAIHEFASGGGRVILSFTPDAGLTESLDAMDELFGISDDDDDDDNDAEPKNEDEDKDKDKGEDEDEDKDDDEDKGDDDEEFPDWGDEPYSRYSDLGISIGRRDDDDWRELHGSPAVGTNEISINWPEVPWRGSLYFTGLSEDWKVIYQQADEPVIVERAIGSGSIVICADSFFLSNEAMIGESTRNPQLLAWLAGRTSIIFDETHLGVANTESISSLAREFGLANLLFVLLAIGALYVWKSSVSLLPRDPEHAERFGGSEIAGRSSALGLHNLLRKCIPTRKLLGECLARWSASVSASRPRQRADRKKIKAIVEAENNRPEKQRDPVKAYKKICRILAERK